MGTVRAMLGRQARRGEPHRRKRVGKAAGRAGSSVNRACARDDGSMASEVGVEIGERALMDASAFRRVAGRTWLEIRPLR